MSNELDYARAGRAQGLLVDYLNLVLTSVSRSQRELQVMRLFYSPWSRNLLVVSYSRLRQLLSVRDTHRTLSVRRLTALRRSISSAASMHPHLRRSQLIRLAPLRIDPRHVGGPCSHSDA